MRWTAACVADEVMVDRECGFKKPSPLADRLLYFDMGVAFNNDSMHELANAGICYGALRSGRGSSGVREWGNSCRYITQVCGYWLAKQIFSIICDTGKGFTASRRATEIARGRFSYLADPRFFLLLSC